MFCYFVIKNISDWNYEDKTWKNCKNSRIEEDSYTKFLLRWKFSKYMNFL